MATGQLNDFLRHLRGSALLRDDDGVTDGQLLQSFLTRQDEASFEVLVRRHGPMVLGVCRRVLGNAHDAEDAFQASFLVLLRKAASIGQRELLGNWLYGVAYRTALEARTVARRRRMREGQVSAMPEPEAPEAGVLHDLRPLLDAELSRLPDKYRVPVVLCDLEGRTRREAARQLRIPEGTLSGRLTTARRRLAKRLAPHGLALSAGALAAALCSATASAHVPPSLIAATVKAIAAIALGRAAASVVSAQVAALSEGVIKTMFLTKLRAAIVVLLATGIIAAVSGLLTYQALAREPQAGQERRLNPAGESSKKVAMNWDQRVLKGHRGMVRFAAFSPTGKMLATGAFPGFGGPADSGFDGGGGPGGTAEKEDEVILWDMAAQKLKHKIILKHPVTLYQLAFSPDGRTLAIGTIGEIELRDVQTGEVKRVLAKGHRYGTGVFSLAFSPDGKILASGGSSTEKTVRLWDVTTGQLKQTLEGHTDEVVGLSFSPDGKTVASVGGQQDPTVRLWDVETGRPKLTLKVDYQPWSSVPVAFSPDGQILAKGAGAWVVFLDTHTAEVKDKLIAAPEPEDRLAGSILQSLAFSPDGKLVAGGRESGEIDVWETRPADGKFDWRAGDLKEALKGRPSGATALAFSPPGDVLASGHRDGVVRLWKLNKSAR
jgi:RNA polymerase sigma factor (sigma-70 family)